MLWKRMEGRNVHDRIETAVGDLESCAADAGKNIRTLRRVSSGNQFGMDEESIAKVLSNRMGVSPC